MNIEKELINERLKNAQLLYKIKFLKEDIKELRKYYESIIDNKSLECLKWQERYIKMHDDLLFYQLEKEDNIENVNEYINDIMTKDLRTIEKGDDE